MADKPFDVSTRVYKLIVILISVVLVFLVFRVAEMWRTISGNYPREIAFEAQGTAYVTPDIATVQLGVTSEGESSEVVVAENTQKMNAVMAEIKARGIEAKDIQTTSYSLYPKYDWSEEGGSEQDGYTLSQTVVVKIRDFTKIGDLLAATTKAGANTISGVTFEVDDPETAKAAAREEAVAKAKAKAEADAKALAEAKAKADAEAKAKAMAKDIFQAKKM
ncbi:MAG: SIMPL domain-containing protein, partial [Patescibacteria group bacterium]